MKKVKYLGYKGENLMGLVKEMQIFNLLSIFNQSTTVKIYFDEHILFYGYIYDIPKPYLYYEIKNYEFSLENNIIAIFI